MSCRDSALEGCLLNLSNLRGGLAWDRQWDALRVDYKFASAASKRRHPGCNLPVGVNSVRTSSRIAVGPELTNAHLMLHSEHGKFEPR